MPLTDEGKKLLERLEQAESSGLEPTERGTALLTRLRQARDAEGGTIEAPTAGANFDVPEKKVPDVTMSELGRALKTGTLGEKRETELGGPLKSTYNALSAPSRALTGSLKSLVSKIPDPETRSAATNFALGLPETMADIGAEVAGGAISPEAVFLAILPEGAIEGPLSKAAAKAKAMVEEKFPAVAQALTGVQKKYFANVARNPKVLLPEMLGGPKSLEAAGAGVEAAEKSAFGDLAKPTIEEINDPAATTAREGAISAANKLAEIKKLAKTDPAAAAAMASEPETGALLLKGKRGTQFQLDQPSTKGSRTALLGQQKEELVSALEEHFPALGPALRDYAASMTNEQATKLLPVLKSGDPSIMRLALTAIGRTAGAPFGLSIPAANSAVIALSKLSLEALQGLLQSPKLAKLAQIAIAQKEGEKNAQ